MSDCLPSLKEADILRALEANSGTLSYSYQDDDFSQALGDGQVQFRKRLLRKMEAKGLIKIALVEEGRIACALTPHGKIVAGAIKVIDSETPF